MQQSKKSLSTGGLIVIMAVLGGVAGAGLLYGKSLLSGNGEEKTATACTATQEELVRLGEQATGDVAAMIMRESASPLPDLVFQAKDDSNRTLQSFAGKTLLVNLWATWCIPCREEMPALAELETAMADENFQVLAINIDTGDAAKPAAFLEEIGVDNLGLYRDPTIGVFNTLKREGLAFGLPVTLLVDRDGCLLGAMNGPAHWSGDDAKALIGALKSI